MSIAATLPLGGPGIYERPDVPLRSLTNVRMDVCAFVGVAPRGPARVRGNPWSLDPVEAVRGPLRSVAHRVDSWDEYKRWFGAFEGTGLLPYAVASFFEQGGERAYIVRIVHDYGDARDGAGLAWGALPGLRALSVPLGVPLYALTSGESSAGLELTATWEITPLVFDSGVRARLTVSAAIAVVPWSLLNVHQGSTSEFRFVAAQSAAATGQTDLALDRPTSQLPTAVDLVTLKLRLERAGTLLWEQGGIGLHPEHDTWLASALANSNWIAPDARWLHQPLEPAHALLPAVSAIAFQGAAPGRNEIVRLTGLRMSRDGLWLTARNEGLWGNALRASLEYRATPILLRRSGAQVVFGRAVSLPVGSLLRLRWADDSVALRRVLRVEPEWNNNAGGQRVQRATLDADALMDIVHAEVIEVEVRVWESGNGQGFTETQRRELHTSLGLSPLHPRWIARVLQEESALVYAADEWLESELTLPSASLPASPASDGQFAGGDDRSSDINPADFFDSHWTPSDEEPASGVHALLDLSDLSLVVVPDLYSPAPITPHSDVSDPGSLAGKTFEPCVHLPARPADVASDELAGLRLDPRDSAARAAIIRLQQRLVELAELQRNFIVLLDVPPGLSHSQTQRWRAFFDSEFAAAYHPWLAVSRADDLRDPLVRVNPSAVAAGLIAQQERAFGVAWGPANLIADGVVDVTERIRPAHHDELHPLGINVYLVERDGVRLTAARTLARTRVEYRQLSVRRLVTMIIRTIEQQMQWAVFEPNNAQLRIELVRMLTSVLRRLYRANAFAGATETDSFFVRCDDALNPSAVIDAGRLIVEVGIAPAEPIEFIVLKIARGGDGVLRVED